MKIAVLTTSRAGVEPVEQPLRQGLVERLAQRGHDVRVVCSESRGLDAFDLTYCFDPRVGATVVQPLAGTASERGRAALRSAPGPAGRWWRRGLAFMRPAHRRRISAERAALRHGRVRQVVAVSRYIADQLFCDHAVPFRQIALVPGPVADRALREGRRQRWRRQGRATLGLADDTLVFAAIFGRGDRDPVEPVLEALDHVRGAGHPAHLVLAGPYSDRLQRRICEMGLRQFVRWVGPTRKPEFLAALADAVVHNTWYDPGGLALLPSVACGLPAISTVYSGAAPWLCDRDRRDQLSWPLATVDPDPGLEREGSAGAVIDSPRNTAALAEAMFALARSAERTACAQAAVRLG
ncbi:MAG: glycosyltransferase, partial [Phycisphaerae bacterium]|nr:glycosyltransferase [Phycisphaerae bacterium]